MESKAEKYKNGRYNKNLQIEYEDKKDKEKNFEPIQIDSKKASKQKKLMIEGIEVYFPYEPYECQLIYMKKVIEALNNGSLAGLESPTGTGKTLCLLCSSLAWLKKKRKEFKDNQENGNNPSTRPPLIFYTSRTHSQLSNVIKELKKTCYTPRTAILSSRENLCVNNLVKNGANLNINLRCQIARNRKECKYHATSENVRMSAYNIIDIEEMKKIGEASNFCPFYYQRRKKDYSDIIFLPYNYIFNKRFLSILKLDLNNSVLIIDEAHNIDNVCESSSSCELTNKIIDSCLNDLKEIKNLKEKNQDVLVEVPVIKMGKKDTRRDFLSSLDLNKLNKNINTLQFLKSYLRSLDVPSGNWPLIGKRLSSKELFELVLDEGKKPEINQNTITNFLPKGETKKSFDSESFMQNIEFLNVIDKSLTEEYNKNSSLFEYIDFMQSVFEIYTDFRSLSEKQNITYKIENDFDCMANNYRFFVLDEEEQFEKSSRGTFNKKKEDGLKTRKISLFCFNPGLGFKHITNAGIKSIILTSGTLSPFNSLESELKCQFGVKLENTHVIDKKQLNFCLLKNAINDPKALFDFRSTNRSSDINIKLGQTIADLIKVTPVGTGVLCFFTSYAFMNTCIDVWCKNNILSEIEKSKEIFKDMQNSNKNTDVIRNFNLSCGSSNGKNKGGILFSVFRGTSSEGIDFSDDKARMVIIVGIPYPNLGDIKVNLKKEFLEDFCRRPTKNQNFKLKSNDWYLHSAIKAVNQALGRVIRHYDDYGSMVLIDKRYEEMLSRDVFSKWLRESCKIYNDKKILEETKQFFDLVTPFIKQRKLEVKNKLKAIKESNETVDAIENELKMHNSKNDEININQNTKLKIRRIESDEDLNEFNYKGKKVARLEDNQIIKFETQNKTPKINLLYKNNLKDGENDTTDKGNKIPSFMKSNDELEESLNKNSLKNLIPTNQKEILPKKIDLLGNSIKKNLDDLEFSRKYHQNDENIDDLILFNEFIKSDLIMNCFEEVNENLQTKTNCIMNDLNLISQEANNTNENINFNLNKLPNKNIKKDEYASITELISNKKDSENNKGTKTIKQKQKPMNNNVSIKNFFSEKKKEGKEKETTEKKNIYAKEDEFEITEDLMRLIDEECENIENIIKKEKEEINTKNEKTGEKLQDLEMDSFIFTESEMKNIIDSVDEDNKYITNEIIQNINPISLGIVPKNNNILDLEGDLRNYSGHFMNIVNSPININLNFGITTQKNNSNNSINSTKLPQMTNNIKINSTLDKQRIPNIDRTDRFKIIDTDELNTEAIQEFEKLKEKLNVKDIFSKFEIKMCFKEENKPKEKNDPECKICYESRNKKFQAAKCGHTMCSECWDRSLQSKLECPFCKKKTRPKSLTNLFL